MFLTFNAAFLLLVAGSFSSLSGDHKRSAFECLRFKANKM